MSFKKYQSIKRVYNDGFDLSLDGLCYIFPKLDGTNASLWVEDGVIKGGSRKRVLGVTSKKDNANFYKSMLEDENIKKFFNKYPDIRLYGEWLVPHSVLEYVDDAWRNFYVFDVLDKDDNYIKYEDYKGMLEEFGLNYIPLIEVIDNPCGLRLQEIANSVDYLMKDGFYGEGIVVKNYDYKDRNGDVVWRKVLNENFSNRFSKQSLPKKLNPEMKKIKELADEISEDGLILKEYHKIKLEVGSEDINIGRLLSEISNIVIDDNFEYIAKQDYIGLTANNEITKGDHRSLKKMIIYNVKNTLKQAKVL